MQRPPNATSSKCNVLQMQHPPNARRPPAMSELLLLKINIPGGHTPKDKKYMFNKIVVSDNFLSIQGVGLMGNCDVILFEEQPITKEECHNCAMS